MSIEETRAIARRWIDEIWDKPNEAAFNELLADNFSYTYPDPGMPPDLEGYKQGVLNAHASFPDLRFTAEDMVVEGNKASVYWVGHGTHKGNFYGVPPTGKTVTMEGISIIDIAGGKIVKEVAYMNMMEMMQQVGAGQ